MPVVYDRSFSIPVILDLSALSEQETNRFLSSISDLNPQELTYPSVYAHDVAVEMSKKGYPAMARPLPFDITSNDALQILARCLKKYNEHAAIRMEPNPSVISKKMASTADFERIVDELLEQQDGITLSAIFKTGELKSRVYWTKKTCGLNVRIGRTIIPVLPAANKKAAEERLTSLNGLIQQAFITHEDEERVTFKKKAKENFQYR